MNHEGDAARITRRVGAMFAVLVIASTTGCAHLTPGRQVTVKGELGAGAECLMLTTTSGKHYSLTGNPDRFKIGDRVCIRGKVAGASICMAGEGTISIEAIGPEDACP